MSNLKSYCLQIATELDNFFLPKEDVEFDKLINDAVGYWERNIAPELAAEFIAHKFKLTRRDRVN